MLYRAGVFLVSFWNPKARLWIKGRIGVFDRLRKELKHNNQKTVWMHCASLGEYEQGKPVLDLYLQRFPDTKIVVSFFSPSGYEIVKKRKLPYMISYLPMDSFINAKWWLNIVKPDVVLWVKYEYWHYYLTEIKRRKIPLFLVSGVFRSNQVFFKWYGGFYRKMLSAFTHFFLQDHASRKRLSLIIPKEKITVSGDTRCDRVLQIANQEINIPLIEQFCGNAKTVVIGSSWEDDEIIWAHYVKAHSEINFIIAPHEVDAQNIRDVQKLFPGSILFSQLFAESFDSKINCLIIDNVGMLAKLYFYSHIAYVGGGFGADGLHNILEPAAFGKPVIFGPAFSKNFEAEALIDMGGAISIESAIELEKIVDDFFQNDEKQQQSGTAAENYVLQNAGAAQKIIDFIASHK